MWSLIKSPFCVSKVSFWPPSYQIRSPKVSKGWFSPKKSHGLKMIFLNNHFTFFFSFFSSIFGWEDHFQLGSWCEGWLKLISSQEKPSKRLILEVTGFRYWKSVIYAVNSIFLTLLLMFGAMMVLVWCWLCSQFVMYFVTTNPHHSLFFLCPRMWTWTCLFRSWARCNF